MKIKRWLNILAAACWLLVGIMTILREEMSITYCRTVLVIACVLLCAHHALRYLEEKDL